MDWKKETFADEVWNQRREEVFNLVLNKFLLPTFYKDLESQLEEEARIVKSSRMKKNSTHTH